VVMCLGQGADLHMAQLMPLPLTISCCSKSRLVLPFWCRLTQVVRDKMQEGRKTVVCSVCVCGGEDKIQPWFSDRLLSRSVGGKCCSMLEHGKQNSAVRLTYICTLYVL